MFTIITPTYNSSKYIKNCIDSVNSQVDSQWLHLIVDNCSTDDTCKLVASAEIPAGCKRELVVAETSIYSALNLALSRLNSESWVHILNSDDVYSDVDSLAKVKALIKSNCCEAVLGDVVISDSSLRIVRRRYQADSAFFNRNFELGWMPPHPGIVFRNRPGDVFFDEQIGSAADYGWVLDFFYINKRSFILSGEVLVVMREGGVSSRGFRSILSNFVQDYLQLKTRVKRPLVACIFKRITKVGQWV